MLELETMCAMPTLVEEQLESQQEDFSSALALTSGGGVGRLFPGEERSASGMGSVSRTLANEFDKRAATQTITIAGALGVSTSSDEPKVTMFNRVERSPNGSMMISFFDRHETLRLDIVGDTEPINVKTHYTNKPLSAALQSARFFELLATTPGVLFFEAYEQVDENTIVPRRIEIAELPLSVPEPELEGYRNRLQLLEGLYDIFVNTEVEIRYPENTEDVEGLDNFNFVVKAVRGGWVASSVANFDTHMPVAEVRRLLDELRSQGEVLRAFGFDLPNESYRVFDKVISLGPSRRYLAAARLATSQEEIESWLDEKPKITDALEFRWEPIDDTPMHVFFGEWPKSSMNTINRDLQEFEIIYGISSEDFGRAWREHASWARDIPDGKRWFSLIQAREELAQEP